MVEEVLALPLPTMIEISIELNTAITNPTNDDTDAVMGLTYTEEDILPGRIMACWRPWLLENAAGSGFGWGKIREVLSDDGMAIMWEILASRTRNRIAHCSGRDGCYQRPHGRCLCGGKWRRYHRDGYGQRLGGLLAVRLSSRT